MSALWIVPALVLLAGAVVLAGLLRGLADARSALRAELARLADLGPSLAQLRADVEPLRRSVGGTGRR